MKKRNQPAKAQSDKKSRPELGRTVVEGQRGDLVGSFQLPGGPITAVGDGTIQAQAAWLDDARLQDTQRHALAARIGQLQGNQYLQRVIASTHSPQQSPDSRGQGRDRYPSNAAVTVQRFGERQHEAIEEEAVYPEFPEAIERQQIALGNWQTDFNQICEIDRYMEEWFGVSLGREVYFDIAVIMAEARFGQDVAVQMDIERFGQYRAVQHFDNPLSAGAPLEQPGERGGQGDTAVPFYITESIDHIRRTLEEAIYCGPIGEGRELFGSALHTIEDLFAHSNFVEIALRLSGREGQETYGGTVESGADIGRYRLVSGTFGYLDTAVSILHMIAENLREPIERGGSITTGDRITLVLLRRLNPSLASLYERYLNYCLRARQEAESWLGEQLAEGLVEGAYRAREWLSSRIGDVIDRVTEVMTRVTAGGVQPSHSEVNKDDPSHPLYPLAHALAVHVAREITRLMPAAWSNPQDPQAEQAVMDAVNTYTQHPQDCTWWQPMVEAFLAGESPAPGGVETPAEAPPAEETEAPPTEETGAPPPEEPRVPPTETGAPPPTEEERRTPPTEETGRMPAGGREETPPVRPTARERRTLSSSLFRNNAALEAVLNGERYLRRGSRGTAVIRVQQALINAGYPMAPYGADGIFGPETEQAVRQFQRSQGLRVDGIVGPQTLGALDQVPTSSPPQEEGALPTTTPPQGEGTSPTTTPRAGGTLPRVHLVRPRSYGRAYMLDWNTAHRQINQDETLREAFEENLNIQLERLFGEAITREQLMRRIEQAEAEGRDDEARQMNINLFIANEYAVVETLDVEHSQRYLRTPEDTFCNIYAYDVVTALGGYLPRVWWTEDAIRRIRAGETVQPVYGRTVREMNANALTDWLHTYGAEFGWRRAEDINAAQEAANNGMLVVLLAARTPEPRTGRQRAGHVNVIMPEMGEHRAVRGEEGVVTRPLQSQAGATNFMYRPHRSRWWEARGYRGGGAWIFEGRPSSPLLTPEQLGGGWEPREAQETTPTAPRQEATPPAEQQRRPPAPRPETTAPVPVEGQEEGAFEYALRVTGQFESGNNYGALQLQDVGVVSYGRYQFTLTSGNLYRVLQEWLAHSSSREQAPVAWGTIQDRVSVGERSFQRNRGLARDEAFLDALRQAGRTASMRTAQDNYERQTFYEPAARRARAQGVQSHIGIAIFFDTRNQSLQGVEYCLRAMGGARADEIGERTYLHRFLDARVQYLQEVAQGQRRRAQEARRGGDEERAVRLERTAGMLERAPRRRIEPLRQRVNRELPEG